MAMRGQGRVERRRGERRVRKFTPKMWLGIGGGMMLLLGFLAFLILASSGGEGSGQRYPQIGDHWHAPYTVIICGEDLPTDEASDGQVHSHGDGRVHIHPQSAVDVGRNATLQRYFASVGFELDDDRIKLPGGEEYSNEDECPSGDAGEVFLRVNGIRIVDVASFVPRNDDIVEVGFGVQ